MTTIDRAIDTEFEEGVFFIYFNKPESRNPLNREVRLALCEAINNPPLGTRVIFLRGRGGVFCSGQDLKEFLNQMNQNLNPERILEEEYEPILSAIDASKVPVIAVVEGACVGAGLSLALACDYILASEGAYFQLSFAKIALSPDVGASFLLPQIVGRSNALAMALTYDAVDCNRAQQMGLVWEVHAKNSLEEAIARHRAIYVKGAPRSFDNIRKLIRGAHMRDFQSQLDLEGELQANCIRSKDFKEAVTAFFEKREPMFKGE